MPWLCSIPELVLAAAADDGDLLHIKAETNHPPFDLAEAESELVAGFMVEYGSSLYMLFMLAEYVAIVLQCAMLSILFMGGWASPIDLPPFNWIQA